MFLNTLYMAWMQQVQDQVPGNGESAVTNLMHLTINDGGLAEWGPLRGG
jgi:hypothetical protein